MVMVQDILAIGKVLLRCMTETVAIGVVIGAGLRALPRPAWRGAFLAAVALVVPGVLAASWRTLILVLFPDAWDPHGPAPHWVLVPAALPLLLVFVLGRISRLRPGLDRAAMGLGAGRRDRLRLVWLPQLGPPILLGVGLATLLDAVTLFRD